MHSKKIAPVVAPLDTKSASAFPVLGSGSSGSSAVAGATAPKKLDFKKVAIASATLPVQAINKITAEPIKVKPSSTVVTHCYDEFGEDYDGPDEWEMEREADEFQLNAALPVGGRRGGF
jgi:hypothetical protein